MYLNTGFWWFRKYNKEILIFKDQIASTDYLYTVITKNIEATIYYYNVSSYLNFDEILKYYVNTKVILKKIAFKPSKNVQHKTRKGKMVLYSTIILTGDDTIIFDIKQLGLKKDSKGDKQVYRVKDRGIYHDIRKQFDTLLTN